MCYVISSKLYSVLPIVKYKQHQTFILCIIFSKYIVFHRKINAYRFGTPVICYNISDSSQVVSFPLYNTI